MPFQFRSKKTDELTEVIEAVPGWYIRFGLSVIFVVFLVSLLLLNSYKYPTKITFPIVAEHIPMYSTIIVTGFPDQDERRKISKGQPVKFELDKFPAMAYGYFEGIISEISDGHINQKYIVKIRAEKNDILEEIDLENNSILKGTATIVYKDKTVFESLFSSIK